MASAYDVNNAWLGQLPFLAPKTLSSHHHGLLMIWEMAISRTGKLATCNSRDTSLTENEIERGKHPTRRNRESNSATRLTSIVSKGFRELSQDQEYGSS
jgi:hypothetical protein